MSSGMEIGIFLAYAMGMLIVYMAGRYLMVPLRWLVRLMINSAAGGAAIMLINFVGGNLGVFVPVNAATALAAGVLGLPGIVLLIIFFS